MYAAMFLSMMTIDYTSDMQANSNEIFSFIGIAMVMVSLYNNISQLTHQYSANPIPKTLKVSHIILARPHPA